MFSVALEEFCQVKKKKNGDITLHYVYIICVRSKFLGYDLCCGLKIGISWPLPFQFSTFFYTNLFLTNSPTLFESLNHLSS